jgi:hypothetical protein
VTVSEWHGQNGSFEMTFSPSATHPQKPPRTHKIKGILLLSFLPWVVTHMGSTLSEDGFWVDWISGIISISVLVDCLC